MTVKTYVLDCLKAVFYPQRKPDISLPGGYKLKWRKEDLFEEGFFHELTNNERAEFYRSPGYKRPIDYWIEITPDDVVEVMNIAIGVIEDHISYDGYIDTDTLAGSKKGRDRQYGLVYGSDATIFAYRESMEPDKLVVRVRFDFDGGHYYIFGKK